MSQTKLCAGPCGEEKDTSFFSRDRSKEDGLQRECKPCRKLRYEQNKHKAEIVGKIYREAHKEEIKAYKDVYREANRPMIREHDKIYRETHKEELSERDKKWRKEHPDQVRASKHRYRHRLRVGETDVTDLALARLRRETTHCYYCNIRMTDNCQYISTKKTIEHRIPGKHHMMWNIVYACARDNFSKGDKTEKEYRALYSFDGTGVRYSQRTGEPC